METSRRGSPAVGNLWIYGVGGIIVPFVGIKLIDMFITRVGMA